MRRRKALAGFGESSGAPPTPGIAVIILAPRSQDPPATPLRAVAPTGAGGGEWQRPARNFKRAPELEPSVLRDPGRERRSGWRGARLLTALRKASKSQELGIKQLAFPVPVALEGRLLGVRERGLRGAGGEVVVELYC